MLFFTASDFTSITSHICLGSVSSFFLELFLYWSPVAYWTYWPGEFIFQCPIFSPFHTVHGDSRQEYWSIFPFSLRVDLILSEFSTMTCPSWVGLYGMAHSFIELDKAVVHVIRLVSFLWLWFSVCLPSDGEGWEAYGSFLMGVIDWGGNWVLFCWAGPGSVKLYPIFCW